MTATSVEPKRGGARVGVQRFGSFLSNMVLPNIAAFIAWGLITAIFIPDGWWNLIAGTQGAEQPLAALVGPMITYLLPLLIANTGGRLVYGVRGGVVGTIAAMGVIVGSSIPMFLGAMIMGPLAAWVMKQVDRIWDGKIKAGFEMLVNNFSAGILGMLLAILGFFGIAPAVTFLSGLLEQGVDFLVSVGLLPLVSLFIEPGKVLFLNNAINQGVLTPLGTVQAQEDGQSILFLLEANPGPGLGILLAFAIFGIGLFRSSAPGAILIQFIGGIHEIYFPYVLSKPILILAAIAGGMTGVFTNVVFGSGLRAPASPGSIIAVLIQTPLGSMVGVILSVVLSAAVSFVVAAVILRASRKRDLEREGAGDLAAAVARTEAAKGKSSSVLSGLGAQAERAEDDAEVAGITSTAVATKVQNIVFACDAGMGSSAMGATVLRNKIKKAGIEGVTVVNKAIDTLDDSADLVITQRELTPRAEQRAPHAQHVSVDNFMNSPRYDEVVTLVAEQNK
ncbi:PTS mannitol transporter subunit IICB [Amnibacterium flavum]|uniref:PTS system mannitol-specific EIICB component n=1 Tax=Amnibacterium flavum TaxID=2173173 RepID=A0A2V1HRA7_9MICO|nr:PTS mannitol transporter subunit IICB [Amnibacterium flavum]PVZ95078.1 PTS mannitol transporter subunit IIB [Amnibacterium flavum]